jgi:hypothetical protein
VFSPELLQVGVVEKVTAVQKRKLRVSLCLRRNDN